MSLKINTVAEVQPKAKPKAVHSSAKPVAATEVEALADELVLLERRMHDLEVKKLVDRRDELRKTLLSHFTEANVNETISVIRPLGTVIFSACAKVFTLTDKQAMANKLGPDLTLDLAEFNVGKLKTVLSEIELYKFGEDRPGSRNMKIAVK